MKKFFPATIVLIVLSLVGVMYFQVAWIRSAAKTQKIKYKNQVANALEGIRNDLLNKSIEMSGYDPDYANKIDEAAKSYFWERSVLITPTNVSAIIRNQLEKNAIDLDFDYIILNRMNYAVVKSANFVKEDFNYASRAYLDNEGSLVLYLYIKASDSYIWSRLWWMIAASILFSIIIFAAFLLTVGAFFKQRKITEIKTDFINNMTHEFKTPLATISLAVGALKNKVVRSDSEKMDYYTGIIKDENARMNKQVEKILEAAKMESDQLDLNIQTVNIHEQIQRAVNNISLSIEHLNGTVLEKLQAKNVLIAADEVHFANVINNLLDNAVKYSKNAPNIAIETLSNSNKAIIKVRDSGIGMSKDTLSHIFEKFYRAHTGNIHNVKGFGLGLSYVKAVMDAHKGRIKAESAPGKGSVFTLEFPLLKK